MKCKKNDPFNVNTKQNSHLTLSKLVIGCFQTSNLFLSQDEFYSFKYVYRDNILWDIYLRTLFKGSYFLQGLETNFFTFFTLTLTEVKYKMLKTKHGAQTIYYFSYTCSSFMC